MKKILGIALLLTACSSQVVVNRPPNPRDRWTNLTNAQNKVVASWNSNDGQIIYAGDPKEAFETMLAAFLQYQQSCKPVEKKEDPKKVEKKK